MKYFLSLQYQKCTGHICGIGRVLPSLSGALFANLNTSIVFNYIQYNVWDGFTYQLPNLNGVASDVVPTFTGHVVTSLLLD